MKHVTLLSDANVQVRFRAQQREKYSLPQLYCSHKVSPCQTSLRITNHRGHKFPPSVTLPSFKTRIKWRPVLTATACFPSVFFQLQQYSRKHLSFSAHKAALMTKTELIFQAFSLTFVDFAVQFCFRCKFSFHAKPFESSLTVAWFLLTNHNSLLRHSNQWDCFIFVSAKVGKGRFSSNWERFWNKKLKLYVFLLYKTNRFHVAVRLFNK